VWSFGVVMYEILTRGEEPYPDIMENKVVMAMVIQGYRMPKPSKKVRAPQQWHCFHADAFHVFFFQRVLGRKSIILYLPYFSL
jgi:hypothetical protein